jgi:glycerate kinase
LKIIVCPDKFKYSLTAQEFCEISSDCLKENHSLILLPMSDGGEGTLSILNSLKPWEKIEIITEDALGREIEAYYLYDLNTETAYIEMALASGLQLLGESEKNPMETSSFGTGLLIKDALQNGAKKIVLFIGGSATNDAGMGMAEALGYEFYDSHGKYLRGNGKNLIHIKEIRDSEFLADFGDIDFEVATDVENPLYGLEGAAFYFAEQKGANLEMIRYLDKGLINMNHVFEFYGRKGLENLAGAGAAGGMGAGAVFFLNARIVSGSETFFRLVDFKSYIQDADMIITGEGKVDRQTFYGKLVSKVLDYVEDKQVLIIAGTAEENIEIPENVRLIRMDSWAGSMEKSIEFASQYLREILIKEF